MSGKAENIHVNNSVIAKEPEILTFCLLNTRVTVAIYCSVQHRIKRVFREKVEQSREGFTRAINCHRGHQILAFSARSAPRCGVSGNEIYVKVKKDRFVEAYKRVRIVYFCERMYVRIMNKL